MKSAETAKTSAAQLQTKQEDKQSFFLKEGAGGVFSSGKSFFPGVDGDNGGFFSPKPTMIQAKLTIGAPNDVYEQEADSMADKVVQKLASGENNSSVQRKCADCTKEDDTVAPKLQMKSMFESAEEPTKDGLQRKCGTCVAEKIQPAKVQMKQEEEETKLQEKKIQRMSGEAEPELQEKKIQKMNQDEGEPQLQAKSDVSNLHASTELERQLDATKGSGYALQQDTRTSMESSFGADFSNVRVHTNNNAVQMSQELGAQAFTHGSDIYFNSGKYNTQSSSGQHLLAHELTHTIQQKGAVRAKSSNPSGGALAANMNSPAMSRLISSKAASFVQAYGRPISTTSPLIQRSTSHGVSVRNMRFLPNEIPADGATTSQAKVHYSGHTAGSKVNWSIIGPAYGTVVDANGLITPGAAIKKGEDKVNIKVKAEDSVHAGANTHGFLTLWDVKYLQAKKDFPLFRSQVFKQDPFAGPVGSKFAIQYQPQAKRFDATVRVSFAFLDDKPGSIKWNKKSKRLFEQKFIRVIQNRWSNQFQFENIREPQSVWKKLNPVTVRINVKKDIAAPHFAISVHKKKLVAPNQANVAPFAKTADFGHRDDTPNPAFNPATGVAELAALVGINPSPILFGLGKSDVSAADKGKLEFMATYLRRIKNPRFKINIIGHHQTVIHAAGATAVQKNNANQQAKKLSKSRAKEVFKIFKDGRATFHQIRNQGVGDAGAAAAPAWDNVVINSALPPGWKNVQTTLEHEAGHMFGLDDEYVYPGVAVGANSQHYALTMQAFGKQYADLQANIVADSASLMNGGNDIRPHHYVTFWDGLTQLTSAAAVPIPLFGQADWKFRGEH